MTAIQRLPCVVLISLFLAFFIGHADARTHMRSGPSANKPEVTLHGSAIVDSYWSPTAKTRKQVGWSAKLLKDVITWYDLSADKISIKSCSAQHVEFAGAMLDPTDYQPESVFVIDLADWESSCATPQVQSGISEEDDVLFYEIKSVKNTESGLVNLEINRISGESVVPDVTLDVSEDQGTVVPDGTEGEVAIFGDDKAASVSRQAISLPTTSRALNLGKNSSLTTEVSLAFNAGVSASITGFRLRRLRGLKFAWTQGLAAEASATFSITKEVEVTRDGRLIQIPVPKFGFRTRRIPFVGRASAGAFVRVDWVLELNAKTTVTASFDARREIRRSVEAKIFPPRFSTKPLKPLGENRQSSSLDFGAEAEASVTGFAGVRPSLGVEVALGKKNAGGNIGVKLGLELATTIKSPPFEAVSGGGLKIGVCDKCHSLQGALDFRVKDLSLQLERNQRITEEIVLLEEILDINIATVCAIPATCGVSTIPAPDPIPLPEPTPASTVTPTPSPAPLLQGSCKRCRRTRDCPPRHRCRGARIIRRGRCRLQLTASERCGGRCTDCKK